MNWKVSVAASILAAGLLGWCGAASAQDTGSQAATCFDCHGPNGVSASPDVPVIAGQSPIVIEDNLQAFKAKERPCPQTGYKSGDTSRAPTDMCAVAGALSDDQISGLADYFSAQTFVGHAQTSDPSLAAAGRKIHERDCEKCHTEGGSLAEDDAGILAGQWTPYLKKQFAAFEAGERTMPEKMAPKIEKLEASDIEALLNYYASEGGQSP